MATLWVIRKKHAEDPLLATLDGIRQAVVAREAGNMNLHCRYEEYEDQWVDMAVTGPIAGIAELVRKCASLGISGFVITIENDEDEKEVKAIEKAINILNLEFSVVDFAG